MIKNYIVIAVILFLLSCLLCLICACVWVFLYLVYILFLRRLCLCLDFPPFFYNCYSYAKDIFAFFAISVVPILGVYLLVLLYLLCLCLGLLLFLLRLLCLYLGLFAFSITFAMLIPKVYPLSFYLSFFPYYNNAVGLFFYFYVVSLN